METNCGCVHHPGYTHEEHMDELDREMNKERWERSDKGKMALLALCQAEHRRLTTKLFYMSTGQIRKH